MNAALGRVVQYFGMMGYRTTKLTTPLAALRLFSALALLLCRPAIAVIQDEPANQTATSASANYTTIGPPGVAYGNIGVMYNGSAVYIGNGWR